MDINKGNTRPDEQSRLVRGASSASNHDSTTLSNIFRVTREDPRPSKRPASAVSSSSEDVAVGTSDGDKDVQIACKRSKSEATGEQTDSDGGEFDMDVVFAVDYCSSVSQEEFQVELNFVKQLAQSWNISPEGLVVYGHSAKAVPFNPDDGNLFTVQLGELRTKTWLEKKTRRMDLGLTEAAGNFTASSSQHQLVVLVTTGKQISNAENKDDDQDQDLLVSASKELSSRNVKIIIVPVGLETDFRQLGLIVKRPQSLYPLASFVDMTPDTAQKVASNIVTTIDIEKYAKKKLYSSVIPQSLGLWENISLCSDVLEGAWYLLYDDQKEPKRDCRNDYRM